LTELAMLVIILAVFTILDFLRSFLQLKIAICYKYLLTDSHSLPYVSRVILVTYGVCYGSL